MSYYPNDIPENDEEGDYEDGYSDNLPPESTRPVNSTPITRDNRPVRRAPSDEYDPDAYSRPALPRRDPRASRSPTEETGRQPRVPPKLPEESRSMARYSATENTPDSERNARSNRSTGSVPRARVPQVPATPPPVPPYPATPPPVERSRRRERNPRPDIPRTTSKRDSGFYLPWWSLLIMLIFVGAAAIGAWAVVGMLGGDVAPGGQTPIVVVVTATFTIGPPPTWTTIPQPPTFTPPPVIATAGPTPTLPPGDFVVGARVKVIGVGTDGLNIRVGPGRDSSPKFQAPEDEEFILKSGPERASGDEWWQVESPNDSTRGGWASRRYLMIVTPTP